MYLRHEWDSMRNEESSHTIKYAPYYEHLQIAHFFDTMHIGKNVTKMIWQILDRRIDKDKIGKNYSDIEEANHTLQSAINSNAGDGDRNISLPWLLIEQQRNSIK